MLKAQLPGELEAQYEAALEDWKRNGKVERLWRRDAALWTSADQSKWMGWLDVVAEQLRDIQQLLELQRQVHERGFKHCVLLGMGGSSLSPEVTSFTFGKQNGYPQLLILDSTDPAQIRALESEFAYDSTLFVVASKSGSTLEPNIFKQYFFERTKQELGADKAGEHFIAITDPGSKMQKVAEADHFWKIFFGLPSIGGRYSALSNFGMVPAAIAGVDIQRLLAAAQSMHERCRMDADQNPGVMLGCALGALGNAGHDKVTIIATDSIFDLGAWLEQLIAESTGKEGKGIVPVVAEPLPSSADVYGNDRA
ncbi:MAG TPA: transaldolase, partial [Terriglobales bacterium]